MRRDALEHRLVSLIGHAFRIMHLSVDFWNPTLYDKGYLKKTK
ncbi:hypothetical protein HMPREF9103_01660 [Lentilactobacillus parafarraginis F0439]|uniref:Uncharacterized protein n=1 Tax=Lentilactobacillus parafarraginis F0439 TaxID=797515 RepID=G9ZPK6_9LACO|nr:hypothetical protein HMPREF9103_01660 [Lentilactobacillus parafarraginis F0439]